MRTSLVVTLLASTIFLGSLSARAEDWPAYQKDARRSSITSETLPLPAKLAWERTSYLPSPAWPDPGRSADALDFDHGYYPVAAKGLLYFASSTDDTLYCVEASSGKMKWLFVADAPLRFAPQIFDGRCYIAGDDGIAYCLDATTGKKLWQFEGCPSNRMLMGNGQMSSRWPCRTGVLVAKGLVYFAAGMWPAEGVYLYALDAKTGKLVWCNDTSSSMYRAFPHDGVSFGGPVPQGYLLESGGRLIVPTGLSAPAFFNSKTGEFVAWQANAGGSTWMTVAGKDLLISARGWISDQDVRFGEAPTWESDGLTFREIQTGKSAGGSWRGYDKLPTSARIKLKARLRGQVSPIGGRYRGLVDGSTYYFTGMGKVERFDIKGDKPAYVWQIEHPRVYSMVMTPETLLLGSADKVTAIRPADGKEIWSAPVDGQARGVIVANKTLYVSTHKGKLYAFSANAKGKPLVYDAPTRKVPVNLTGERGLAVVLGDPTLKKSIQLASTSRFSILTLCETAAALQQARAKIREAGLADQITAHRIPANHFLPYADYCANIVVLGKGKTAVPPTEILRIASPRTGRILFPGFSKAAVTAFLGKAGIEGSEIRHYGKTAYVQRAALVGAFDWDSTTLKADQRVKWPLELLWFGTPGRSRMVARHRQSRHSGSPIPAGGRCAVWAERHVICTDAYNGIELWSQEIPFYETLAANNEFIFVGKRGRLFQLDATNGQLITVYGSPVPNPVQTLENPAQFATEKRNGHFGTIRLQKTQMGLLITLQTTTPLPDRQDSWVLNFDFRETKDRLSPARRGSFPLVVDVNTGAVRRFDGFDRTALVPPLAVKRTKPDTIEVMIPFTSIQKLVGRLPSSFDMRSRLTLFKGDGTQLNDMPFTKGRDLFGNGTMTFTLKPDVAKDSLPSNLVTYADKSKAPAMAQKIGKVPPHVRTDGNKGHPPLATKYNENQSLATRENPFTQQEEEKRYVRGYGCSGVVSSSAVDFFRSGTLGIYDVVDDSGMRNFPGMKPGCRITILPAMGVVVSVEGNADCFCPYSIATSLALAPARYRRNEDWALFYHNVSASAIDQVSLNLGAPGDRRNQGELWLGYPRSETMLATGGCFGPVGHAFGMPIVMEGYDQNGILKVNTDRVAISGTSTPWISGSALAGIKNFSINMTYTEPRTTFMAVPASKPMAIDGKLSESTWGEMPALPLKLSRDDRGHLGEAAVRFDAANLYFGYKQRAKMDRRGTPAPWRPSSKDNIWRGNYFDAILFDSNLPVVAHIGIGKGGHRYGVLKSFLIDLPKLPALKADGQNSEWASHVTLPLGKGLGHVQLAWTPKGIALLCELPKTFTLAKTQTALRLQLFDRASAHVAELLIDPAKGMAELLKPTIEKPGSSDWRLYAKTTPLDGAISTTTQGENLIVEALIPFDAFGGKEIVKKGLGLALVAFDPNTSDRNISGGREARRRIFRSLALTGVRFSDKSFTQVLQANRPQRQWFGSLLHYAPTEKRIPDSVWSAAMTETPGELFAEIKLSKAFLREEGLSEKRTKIKFMNLSQIPNDASAIFTNSKGARRIFLKPQADTKAKRYTLQLHFTELRDLKPGDRVFDILVQGKPVINNFDIAREAGGPFRAITKEIKNVPAEAAIHIEFRAKTKDHLPIINGLEIMAE